MKQVIQSLSDGTTSIVDVPSPRVSSGKLLIRTSCSLISAGTERMLIDFGKANPLSKALQQPDKVRQTLTKISVDGLPATLASVSSKLSEPLPLGYCNVGTVIAIGDGVTSFQIGDVVASNGPHAELVVVPENLCSLVPDNVSHEAASFTVLASIGLQGIRLANPTFGETFVVSGLGLIGLLTAQLLIGHGCRVLGLDPDPSKCALASEFGVSTFDLSSEADPVAWCLEHTSGVGADGVLITASTPSSEPIHIAALSCRQRGRIVLVGVTGLELRRDLFYKKELSFQVSCSYGPGRHDPSYEQLGRDYPIGFVRWTEQRNFQAVLHAFSGGVIRTESLVSHRYHITEAPAAYELLSSPSNSLGIILNYSSTANPDQKTVSISSQSIPKRRQPDSPVVSFIGAGNYSRRTLIPAFATAGAQFSSIVANNGLSPVNLASKYGFSFAGTDVSAIFSDPRSSAVVIASRHDSHASLVQQSLSACKHVFVEKPLCLSTEELESIKSVYTGSNLLMVGFNRRFAPLLRCLNDQLKLLPGPKTFVYTCNAGFIPADHWTQDPSFGGGRLLGEACHFVDLIRYLASSPIIDLQLHTLTDIRTSPDTFSIQLCFANGSIGTVHYFSNGAKTFPKERLEVFASGRVLRLDNFRKLEAWGIRGFRARRTFVQDKGQRACCAAFLNAIETGTSSPIPVLELFEVQQWLLEAVNK